MKKIGRPKSWVSTLNCVKCGVSFTKPTYRWGVRCLSCKNAARRERTRDDLAFSMLSNARKNAAAKSVPFSLTKSDIVVPEFCPVLGIRLVRIVGSMAPEMPTIDRVDNALGYVPGNVRVISWRANKLKSNATVDELRRIVRYVEGHS